MATLTSGGAVNLTTSTNWSPVQIPVAGDDLIIGAHTLTLDADMALNTITLNNASSRFAISGTSRSVEATNGFRVNASLGTVGTAAIPTGTSLTLTGQWIAVSNNSLSNIFTSTGGNLTLQTVGANQSGVLIDGTILTSSTWIFCSSWTGGNLITIGRIQIPNAVAGSTLVTMSGGTWSHQSVGSNNFAVGGFRACNTSGTATVNWTGSVDTQTNQANGGFFTLGSSSVTNTVGQTGDTFCLRNATVSAAGLTALVWVTASTVELVGLFSARLDGLTVYITGGTVNWRNQSYTIPATDHVGIYCFGGTANISGLALTTSTKVLVFEMGSGAVTVSAGTSITCTSTSAYALGFGFTGLDDKIIILESDPPTLPSVEYVAAGTTYGYTASLLTGTGLVTDPAVFAAAMITSFSSLPEVMVRTTIATLTNQTEFTLTAGSGDNDVYNNLMAIITDQSTSVQKAAISISDYVGSTKTITLSASPGFTIATGDLVTVLAGAGGGSSFPSEAPSDWLKSTSIQAGALNGKGDWSTSTQISDVPTVAEFEARTLPTASYATASQINSLQVNTRASVQVPVEIETPDSGTQIWKIRLFLFDEEGNMEAPDSTPTITLVNAAGTNRASRLSVATVLSTGAYSWDYTATDDDAEEQLNWTFTVVEGGLTRIYPATSYVVEETAYRFSSTDRATLNAAATQTSLDTLSIKIGTPQGADLVADIGTIQDGIGLLPGAVSLHLGNDIADGNGPWEQDAPIALLVRGGFASSAELAPILEDTGTNLPAQISGLNNLSSAQVNTEILDVLQTDTFAELDAPPAATSSLKDKLTWLFQTHRNRATQTATERKFYADNGTTVVSTETMSDDGTTFTKGEQA